MIVAGILLALSAFLVSIVGTYLARRYARRLGLMDDPGHRKVHTVATPRNGWIGIFWGFALPLLGGIIFIVAYGPAPPAWAEINHFEGWATFHRHLPGARAHVPLAMLLLAATFGIHLLGLLDDRKPLAPWPKLLAQIAIASGLVLIGETTASGAFRVLTFLGDFPSAGFYASALMSVLWIVGLTNAFNFLDNMDGLSAGVAFICSAMFLIAAVFNQQWFVVALLLVFMGSVLGFLYFNFPPASIFMGDGGSMVLGFILSALTIRTTYYNAQQPNAPHHWYAVMMP